MKFGQKSLPASRRPPGEQRHLILMTRQDADLIEGGLHPGLARQHGIGGDPSPQPLSDLTTSPPSAWAITWWPKQTPASLARASSARRTHSRNASTQGHPHGRHGAIP